MTHAFALPGIQDLAFSKINRKCHAQIHEQETQKIEGKQVVVSTRTCSILSSICRISVRVEIDLNVNTQST